MMAPPDPSLRPDSHALRGHKRDDAFPREILQKLRVMSPPSNKSPTARRLIARSGRAAMSGFLWRARQVFAT